jgi:hypothetical protein
MKKLIIAIFFIASLGKTNAQSPENYNWYFGNGAAVNFSTGSPVVVLTSAMSSGEGNATISDAAGNLLFYSNGLSVWNRNNVVMPNGAGLMADGITAQAAAIAPLPGSTTLYYLFTMNTWEFTPTDLRYSIIDMTLNGGLGDVTAQKNILVNNDVREQLTIARHGNGTDFWIIVHEGLTTNFLAYPLTSSGLNTTPVISSVGGMAYTGFNRFGYMKVSHDCSKLASALGSPSTVNETVELYDFNSSTGTISNPVAVTTYSAVPGAYAIEFSPDNTKLYVTNYNQAAVYQFDLTAANIPASILNITNGAQGTKCGLLTGADGKIYVGMVNASFLSVINNPNVTGLGCNYQNNVVNLGTGNTCRLGLPNSYEFTCSSCGTFSVDAGSSQTICNGDSVILNPSSTSAISYSWSPSTGLSCTSCQNPTANPTVTTTYTVIASDANACSGTDTVTIYVNALPVVTVTADTSVCDGSSVQLNVTGGSSYIWTPSIGLSNATISNPVATPASTTTYSVSVIDSNGCTGSASMTITVNSLPTVTVTQDTAICAGSSVQLNATGGNAYLWTPSTGLSNATISNPVATPSITTSYTVAVTDANGCSNIGNVTVTINPLPVVTLAPLTSVCDSDPAFALTGGSPTGGIYSGPGVSGNTFDPSVAGLGTHTITYNYTDLNGCSGSASTTITVNASVVVSISSIPNMCVTAGSVTLSGSPAGGTFSGPGVVGNTFDPAIAGAGTHTITYTYSSGSCVTNNTATTTVTVSPPPVVTITSAGTPGCNGTFINSVTLTANTTLPVNSYQWYLNGVPISGATDSTLSVTQSGWYNIIVMLNGCASDSGNTGQNIIVQIGTCGNNGNKVIICHVPDCRYDLQVTICIAPSAVPHHFANHPCDCLGPCSTPHPNHRAEIESEIDYSGIEFSIFPNPFSKESKIEFFLSDPSHTTLEVFDIKGMSVGKLFENDAVENVEYSVKLNGLSEGIYIARLQSGDFIKRHKVIVTK